MLYDVPPAQLGYANGFTLDTYETVLENFEEHFTRSKLVMGFEPGHQAAGGVWEGMDVDKQVVDYIEDNKFGGIMFWAANDKHWKNGVMTG